MGRSASRWARRFRRRERLEQSWLLIPGAYVVAALGLGALIPTIPAGWIELTLAPDSERAILQTVAAGMLSFSALVVSVAVLVVQFGAGQYTPRLVLRFRRDPSFKHALGAFIAPAIYALVSIGHIEGNDSSRSPALTVGVSNLLLIAAVFAFFHLIAKLLDLLRPRRLYGLLREACEAAIDQVYPDTHDVDAPPTAAPTGGPAVTLRFAGRPGVLSAVDLHTLARTARREDVVVELLSRVGEYVRHGEEVLRVHGDAPPAMQRHLLGALILEEERTFTQDPAYAIRTIVDIAIRALSPAVNDPTTAVQGVDTLEAILHVLAHRDLGHGGVEDDDGTLRVVYPAPTWDELLDLALTEIREYGAPSHQVTRRLHALLDGLAADVPASRHASIGRQRALLDRAIVRAHPDPHEQEIARRPDPTGLGGALLPTDEVTT